MFFPFLFWVDFSNHNARKKYDTLGYFKINKICNYSATRIATDYTNLRRFIKFIMNKGVDSTTVVFEFPPK